MSYGYLTPPSTSHRSSNKLASPYASNGHSTPASLPPSASTHTSASVGSRNMFRNFISGKSGGESAKSRATLQEKDRLDLADRLHSALLHPQEWPLVQRHLAAAHGAGRRSKVLDVGTGTGAWARTLANAQPYVDVLAVDINWSNCAERSSRHGNLDFATIDVNQPLPWSSNYFDVIHVKCLALDITGYQRLIERLARVLRPGGLLIVVESEMSYHSIAGDTALPVGIRTWDACVKEAYGSRGIDLSVPSRIASYIAGAGVFSSNPLCRTINVSVEGARHNQNRRRDPLTTATEGLLPRDLIVTDLHRLYPMLLAYGYTKGDIDGLLSVCTNEFTRSNVNYFQRLVAVFAVKAA